MAVKAKIYRIRNKKNMSLHLQQPFKVHKDDYNSHFLKKVLTYNIVSKYYSCEVLDYAKNHLPQTGF